MDSNVIAENACTEKFRTLWDNYNGRKGTFLTQQCGGTASVKGKYDNYTNVNKPSA